MIARAPYESTMGLVQKIFYFHVPSWMMMLLAAIVCGVASAIYLFKRRSPAADRVAWRGRTRRALRRDRPRHRSAVGTKGVGHLVALGRAPDDALVVLD